MNGSGPSKLGGIQLFSLILSHLFVLRMDLGDFSATETCHQFRCGRKAYCTILGARKEAYCTKTVAEKEPIAPF